MYEDALEIHKYLPIKQGSEFRYIKQLWDSFKLLNEGENDVPYFSIVPFHLLFMLAVQYKAYRISAWDRNFYLSRINSSHCRTYGSKNKQQLLRNIPLNKLSVWDTTQSSVKTLCLINEKDLFNLFDIIGIEKSIKDIACSLVDNRNDRLHANGEIDEEAKKKIGEYLIILDHIHKKTEERNINMDVQGNWVEDIEEGDLDLIEFFEKKFLYSQFSPRDFGSTLEEMLGSDKLSLKHFSLFINKGLEFTYEDTIRVLQSLEVSISDNNKREMITKVLYENGHNSALLTWEEAIDLGLL
jgi:hypothetical protein